mmetsp:Transcript_57310/g.113872  ORF Transcript_57310/g.113872 Transcript_57310/m.113872 type:complete len:201 (-) Transcript_57310:836-1438(-)
MELCASLVPCASSESSAVSTTTASSPSSLSAWVCGPPASPSLSPPAGSAVLATPGAREDCIASWPASRRLPSAVLEVTASLSCAGLNVRSTSVLCSSTFSVSASLLAPPPRLPPPSTSWGVWASTTTSKASCSSSSSSGLDATTLPLPSCVAWKPASAFVVTLLESDSTVASAASPFPAAASFSWSTARGACSSWDLCLL